MTRFDDMPKSQQAGILSNNEQFRQFAGARTIKSGKAAEFIRLQCGVNSRAALNTDTSAATRFAQLRTEFDAWRGRIPQQR